ncbi:Protein of unknown function [Gryllus bimaculatus]|nr:Protein of unknown function [Gryllus bimaculatus]
MKWRHRKGRLCKRSLPFKDDKITNFLRVIITLSAASLVITMQSVPSYASAHPLRYRSIGAHKTRDQARDARKHRAPFQKVA